MGGFADGLYRRRAFGRKNGRFADGLYRRRAFRRKMSGFADGNARLFPNDRPDCKAIAAPNGVVVFMGLRCKTGGIGLITKVLDDGR